MDFFTKESNCWTLSPNYFDFPCMCRGLAENAETRAAEKMCFFAQNFFSLFCGIPASGNQ